ncbi:tRNA pseudouridine synthase Pus10-like [Ruditapes philippinarum]|uniref:tRNA pseudouridine synthase Pus10-like n=1 Tax=Ruditapes philippinarum TaxID=129788 RepID=UPI00295B1806|nr:tRNA pseudouridine synthase Pus10-like [Ruditapes philippinarum]
MALPLFTSDLAMIKDIASELSACGCCARCTLRYLGLKDMYFYKGDSKEMESYVKNYTEKKEEEENMSIEYEESAIVESNHEAKTAVGANAADDKLTDNNIVLESKQIIGNGAGSGHKEIVAESDQTNKSDCENTHTESVTYVETCSDKNQDENKASLKEFIVWGERDPQIPQCFVCLGILQNFCSEKYLRKLKEYVDEEGFHYSAYMCSLMIPVCVILREYALMLHLKERFSSVYENKKYTDVAQIKDIWKWRCGPLLTDLLGAAFDFKSKFEVTMTFQYENSNRECSFLLDAETDDTFRKRKQDRRYNRRKTTFAVYTRSNVAKAAEDMSTEEFKRSYQCPPSKPRSYTKCDVKCQNENIFIAGRYNKYSRSLSQTPWLIDGVSKTESSVEELLEGEIKKIFKPSEIKFSSSGREDVDVLMLGNGRPFVLELVNPRRRELTQDEMTKIQKAINANTKDIRCRDLQIVTKEETDILKQGEIDKVKRYSALCWSKLPVTDEQLATLSNIKNLTILQKTPIRVLHRRPLATRDRIIHEMSANRKDQNHFMLEMSTQAGTYVKEFVHSDFGRTLPNVSSLLSQECDILELDVTAVELDWPKTIDTEECVT